MLIEIHLRWKIVLLVLAFIELKVTAPMVYIVNAEYCAQGAEMITLRNTLFTAITRSRALG